MYIGTSTFIGNCFTTFWGSIAAKGIPMPHMRIRVKVMDHAKHLSFTIERCFVDVVRAGAWYDVLFRARPGEDCDDCGISLYI